MCGITGFLSRRQGRSEELSDGLAPMTATLRHRGPDDAGSWIDAEAGVALGHRRLSIVDLSEQGRQPMVSSDGRYVLDYNGEIYNHRDLRRSLERDGARFRGTSDTEVLVAAIAAWGLRTALQRCNGMFALALWDRRERRLALARDRLGEKPLYYGWSGPTLLFGSELKALRAYRGPRPRGRPGRAHALSAPQLCARPLLHLRGRPEAAPGDHRHVRTR